MFFYTEERNLPAIRACGGIPIVLGFLSVKLLPIQVASAQIISHLAPSSNTPTSVVLFTFYSL